MLFFSTYRKTEEIENLMQNGRNISKFYGSYDSGFEFI